MKSVFMIGIFLYSSFAFANGYVCHAEKSVIKFNSETKEAEIRRSISPKFQVTSAEHEDPKTLNFVDGSGHLWGSVQVATGSYLEKNEKWFYVSAIVTKPDGANVKPLFIFF